MPPLGLLTLGSRIYTSAYPDAGLDRLKEEDGNLDKPNSRKASPGLQYRNVIFILDVYPFLFSFGIHTPSISQGGLNKSRAFCVGTPHQPCLVSTYVCLNLS